MSAVSACVTIVCRGRPELLLPHSISDDSSRKESTQQRAMCAECGYGWDGKGVESSRVEREKGEGEGEGNSGRDTLTHDSAHEVARSGHSIHVLTACCMREVCTATATKQRGTFFFS